MGFNSGFKGLNGVLTQNTTVDPYNGSSKKS